MGYNLYNWFVLGLSIYQGVRLSKFQNFPYRHYATNLDLKREKISKKLFFSRYFYQLKNIAKLKKKFSEYIFEILEVLLKVFRKNQVLSQQAGTQH